jgi:transcriptional regulator with XRE-family HTH domain
MIDSPPSTDSPSPATTVTCARVTTPQPIPSLSRMGSVWPVEQFRALLRALMDAAGIDDYAELSRMTGVSQQQFSTWRRGLAQPSRESLAKIAPILGVPVVNLWVAAGLASPDDLDLAEAPDLRVLPSEFRDLADLYDTLNDDEKAFLRRSVARLVAGVRSELSLDRDQPSGRRRAG